MGMCFGSTWSAQSWGKLQRSSLVWEELTQCLCCGSASSSAPVVHLQRLPITSGNLSDLGAGLTQPLGATFTELTIRKAINRGLRKQLCSLPAVILHLLPQGSTQTSPKHYSEQLIVLFWTNVRLPFLKECSEGNEAAAGKCFENFLSFYLSEVCATAERSPHDVWCPSPATSRACGCSLGLQLFSNTDAKSGGLKVRIFRLKKIQDKLITNFQKYQDPPFPQENLYQINLIMLYSTLLCFVTNAKIHDLWSCRISAQPQPNFVPNMKPV